MSDPVLLNTHQALAEQFDATGPERLELPVLEVHQWSRSFEGPKCFHFHPSWPRGLDGTGWPCDDARSVKRRSGPHASQVGCELSEFEQRVVVGVMRVLYSPCLDTCVHNFVQGLVACEPAVGLVDSVTRKICTRCSVSLAMLSWGSKSQNRPCSYTLGSDVGIISIIGAPGFIHMYTYTYV